MKDLRRKWTLVAIASLVLMVVLSYAMLLLPSSGGVRRAFGIATLAFDASATPAAWHAQKLDDMFDEQGDDKRRDAAFGAITAPPAGDLVIRMIWARDSEIGILMPWCHRRRQLML